jgi:hypothetical protein
VYFFFCRRKGGKPKAKTDGAKDYNGDGQWDGQSWDGQTWDGQTWDGQTWDGQTWDGQTWDGQTWDGQTWDGQTWDGQTWDGQTQVELPGYAREHGTGGADRHDHDIWGKNEWHEKDDPAPQPLAPSAAPAPGALADDSRPRFAHAKTREETKEATKPGAPDGAAGGAPSKAPGGAPEDRDAAGDRNDAPRTTAAAVELLAAAGLEKFAGALAAHGLTDLGPLAEAARGGSGDGDGADGSGAAALGAAGLSRLEVRKLREAGEKKLDSAPRPSETEPKSPRPAPRPRARPPRDGPLGSAPSTSI